MNRYIDADALKKRVSELIVPDWTRTLIRSWLDSEPTVDAVPVGAVEQIRWERDMAMQQLSEHGIPFGGKADDVIKVCRCKECQWFDANGDYYDSYCEKNGISVEEDFYCADGERKSND